MGLFLKDGLVSGVLRHFQQDFSYIVAVFWKEMYIYILQ
jgi:hypothetical protein